MRWWDDDVKLWDKIRDGKMRDEIWEKLKEKNQINISVSQSTISSDHLHLPSHLSSTITSHPANMMNIMTPIENTSDWHEN